MIIQVSNKKEFKEFIDFPNHLYHNILKNPHYVAPLNLITKMLIGSYKNPKTHLLLYKREGSIIARLGVKKHIHEGKEYSHFGFFEAIPNEDKAIAELFSYAESLYPSLKFIGPYSFRMEDPYMGLMVAGFEQDPYFMMPYHPDYYADYFNKNGFKNEMEVIAYDTNHKVKLPQKMFDRAKQCEDSGFKIRWADQNSLPKEVKSIAKMFNNALADNWGFEEILDDQVKDLFMLFRFFARREIVSIAHKENEDVASLIMLPNFNKVLKEFKGKLTVKTVFNILFKKNSIDEVRGYALGVKKKFHGEGLGSFLAARTWEKCVNELGFKSAQISWILDSNDSMKNLTLQMEGKPNRKYRIYSKNGNK